MGNSDSDTALRALRRRVATLRSLPASLNDEPESKSSLKNLLLLAGLKILDSKSLLGALGPSMRAERLSKLSTPAILHLMELLHEKVERFHPIKNSLNRNTINVCESHLSLVHAAELADLWCQESSLGYIYQCFNEPIRKAAQSGIQTSNKQIALSELIAFTQIYTPSWVARFLLENTILPISNVGLERLRLIDPACGSGHFLIEAFKFVHALMLEAGCCSIDATKHLATKTIAGVDIDPFATWVTALSLGLLVLAQDADADYSFDNLAIASSEGRATSCNLLGSLAKDWPAAHPLSKKYHVLVTNPPYIGRKLMSRELKTLLKKHYPDSYHDLCTAFLHRAADLMEEGGKVGFITQSSLMYLPSYERLRKGLVGASEDSSLRLTIAVEAGPGVFPLQGGEKVSSMLLVATSETQNSEASSASQNTCKFIDLRSARDKEAALSEDSGPKHIYERSLQKFGPQLRYAFHYCCPDAIFDLLANAKQLQQLAELRQGLATTDNNRFLRLWWEVNPHSLGQKWLPYVKGAGAERWFSTPRHVVNWKNDGSEIKATVKEAYPYLKGKTAWVVKNESFYFKEGLSFSFVNTGRMAVRLLPPGCIFDVAGSAIFPARADDRMALLAYLNSSLVSTVANLLNPTINFQVGDLKRLPVLNFSKVERNILQEAGQECVAHKEMLSSFSCFPFLDAPDLVQQAIYGLSPEEIFHQFSSRLTSIENTLQSLESRIDDTVLAALTKSNGVSSSDAKAIASWLQIEEERTSSIANPTTRDFAQNLVTSLLAQSINLDFPGNQSSLNERILLLDFNNRHHLAKALQLNQTNLQVLEELLTKPASEYLRFEFTRHLMKQCSGVAPIVAFHPADSKLGVIASLPAIHRLSNGKQTPVVTSLDEESNGACHQLAQQILAPAIRALKFDPDAHGKAVVQSLDSKLVRETNPRTRSKAHATHDA